MKKTKLFIPALGLAGLVSGLIPVITSCGNKNGGDQGDETKHVDVEYSAPVKQTAFVIKYRLDSGYSLDTNSSTITFIGETNDTNIIYLTQCEIDKTAKTITVPAVCVTSTKVVVSIKSVIPATTALDDMKNAFKALFTEQENKNMSLVGKIQIQNWRKEAGETEYKPKYFANHDARFDLYDLDIHSTVNLEEGGNTEVWTVRDESGIGWWHIMPNDTETEIKYFGRAMSIYPLIVLMNDSLVIVTVDKILANATYDEELDVCVSSFAGSSEGQKYTIMFSLAKDKTIKNVDVSSETLMGTTEYTEKVITHNTYSVTNKGGVLKIVPPSWEKKGYIKSTDFAVSGSTLEASYPESETGQFSRIDTPTIGTIPSFSTTSSVYIDTTLYKNGDEYDPFAIWADGRKLTMKTAINPNGDYEVAFKSTDQMYISFAPGKLSSTTKLNIIINAYISHGGDKVITLTQTQPE